jgi:hypothetical protein
MAHPKRCMGLPWLVTGSIGVMAYERVGMRLPEWQP